MAIVGDWHSHLMWMKDTIARLKETEPTLRTILHLGDFNITSNRVGKGFLLAVDRACASAGIERVLVTPGNHDDWDRLGKRFATNGGAPAQLSEAVWALPRGHRFTIGATTFLSFGGAASLHVDTVAAAPDGRPLEMATPDEAARAIGGGPVDVLLTHESVDGGIDRIDSYLRTQRSGWSAGALRNSAESRRLTTELWEAVQPRALFHGHLHLAAANAPSKTQRVYSLGRDGDGGNAGILDTVTLDWTWMERAV